MSYRCVIAPTLSRRSFPGETARSVAADGAKTYQLTLPPDVPANDFWSVVVYDPQTRSELQTGQPYPSRNSKRDDLAVNDDGSITLTFGPEPAEHNENNWIQTVAGKGWFSVLRLYGPLPRLSPGLHQVEISADWLGRCLKRRQVAYKRTQRNLQHQQDLAEVEAKQAELQALEKGAR